MKTTIFISLVLLSTNTQAGSPICEVGVDPQTIKQGEGTALWWWSDSVTTADINNIGLITVPSAYKWIYPMQTTTYTMNAKGADGASTTCNTTVKVEGQFTTSPICEMGTDPQVIQAGEGVALWWWSNAVTSAQIDNNIGSVTVPSNYQWMTPAETTTYTMKATGNDGTLTTCNTTVIVKDTPHVEGTFAVYNQAYQENYSADTISEILNNATNAYVLTDPFEGDSTTVIDSIQTLKSNHNNVSAYISVGTGENWRSDFNLLQPYLSSKQWEDWSGEYFVSQTTSGILEVMNSRIDKIASWGFTWVEFDNMDWLEDEEIKSSYHLSATVQESKKYVNSLCDHAHTKGIKCMAKNTVEGFDQFDGVTYESFTSEKNWWDQQGTRDFLALGKPVVIVHYKENDCDGAYNYYQSFYSSDSISFICEDRNTKKYIHYNVQ